MEEICSNSEAWESIRFNKKQMIAQQSCAIDTHFLSGCYDLLRKLRELNETMCVTENVYFSVWIIEDTI